MTLIEVDVWLYGALSRYGGDADQGSFANVRASLPRGSTVADLLARLTLPTEERGVAFINGQLSAMPGLQPDIQHILQDGDRVGLFDLKTMWPFQYRHGASMTEEMAQAVAEDTDGGLRHSFENR